jgi:hypothetical protein
MTNDPRLYAHERRSLFAGGPPDLIARSAGLHISGCKMAGGISPREMKAFGTGGEPFLCVHPSPTVAL